MKRAQYIYAVKWVRGVRMTEVVNGKKNKIIKSTSGHLGVASEINRVPFHPLGKCLISGLPT